MATSSAVAYFPASDSTLSASDINELYAHMLARHSQRHEFLMNGFLELFTGYLNRIKVSGKTEHVWLDEMENASNAISTIWVIFRQRGLTELEMRAITSVLALSFSVSNSSNLDKMRKSSKDVFLESNCPFVITEENKGLFEILISAVFMLWISLDQLGHIAETSNESKSKFSKAMKASMQDNPVFTTWLIHVMDVKFDSDRGTIVTEEESLIFKTDAGMISIMNSARAREINSVL